MYNVWFPALLLDVCNSRSLGRIEFFHLLHFHTQ